MKPYYDEDGITIYHGDCREILLSLTLDSVDAVVTDPPYSSGGMFRGDRQQSTLAKYVTTGAMYCPGQFTGDTMDQRSFFAWSSWWMAVCRRLAKDGSSIAVFTDWRQLPVTTDAIQASGWIWRGIATWHKPGIRMQRGRFSSSAEFLAWGTKGKWSDHDGAPQNVYQCSPVMDKTHIAEKPTDVMQWILSIVLPGGIVLDPFMGVGSTLCAAKATNRRAVGMDIEERYCEIAAKRLAQGVLDFGGDS